MADATNQLVEAAKSLPGYDEMLKKALIAIAEKINTGVDFTVAEMPDVIRQIITYHAVWSWVQFVAVIIFISFIIWYSIGLRKKIDKECCGDDRQISMAATTVITWVICIFGFGIAIFNHLSTAIAATWMPKAFIVDKILQAVSGKSLL